MSTTKQETRQTARRLQDSPWPQVRLSETDRLEAFSDCVLSITITLLVAEIVRPEYAPGQLLERLAEQWASYIAFLASFCYAGVIWLNHGAASARGALLRLQPAPGQPFPSADVGADPTAILSSAIQTCNEFDARLSSTRPSPAPGICRGSSCFLF
jgi:hypothetical protein